MSYVIAFIVAFAVGVAYYKVPSASLKINRVGMARFEEAGPVSVGREEEEERKEGRREVELFER